MSKPKLKEMAVMFLAADSYHAVSKIEWRVAVMVEHGGEKDTYSMDYELEWLKAIKHYAALDVDIAGLDVFDVVAPYKDVLYGLKITGVEDKVMPSKRDLQLVELST